MKKKGVSLIELMVVVVIIGLLAMIGSSKYKDISNSAKVAKVQGNLTAIRTSIKMYSIENGEYPELVDGNGKEGKGMHNDLDKVNNSSNSNLGKAFSEFFGKTKLPTTPAGESKKKGKLKEKNDINLGNPGLMDMYHRLEYDLKGGWAYDGYYKTGSVTADLPSDMYNSNIDWGKF